MQAPLSPSVRPAPAQPAALLRHSPPKLPAGHDGLGSRIVLPVAAVIPLLLWQGNRRQPKQSRRCRVTPRRAAIEGGAVQGTLTFQGANVPRSLRYTGVGSDDGVPMNCEYVKEGVTLKNGRGRNLDLDTNGFALVEDVPKVIDFYNEMSICKEYYPACNELVKRVTGAKKVISFYHTVRSDESMVAAARKRIKQGFRVEKPAESVHNDYSEACAARQVRILTKPPPLWPDPRPLLGSAPLLPAAEADEYLRGGKRWQIVNVWRNISQEPVQRSPLALLDGPSCSNDDLVTFQARAGRKLKEYYFAAYSEKHEWYYFPEVRREEAIIVKTWDSAGELFVSKNWSEATVPTTFCLHTAFDITAPPEAPPRESMEVRAVALF